MSHVTPARPAFARVAGRLARLALLLAAVACDSTTTGPGSGTGGVGTVVGPVNIPSVGLDPVRLGFAVAARDWTDDRSYVPGFPSGALTVGLAVSGFAGGTGTVTVTDATGAVLYARSLAADAVEGTGTTVRGTAPFTVRVQTTRYTGTVALGVRVAAAS